MWYEKLAQTLIQFGFLQSKCDHYLFVYSHQGIVIYALVYVDDILVTGSSFILICKHINSLCATFALKKLRKPEYVLGIQVKHIPTSDMLYTLTKYFWDLLTRVKMYNTNGVTTSMLSTCKLSKHGSSILLNLHQYRSMVKSL